MTTTETRNKRTDVVATVTFTTAEGVIRTMRILREDLTTNGAYRAARDEVTEAIAFEIETMLVYRRTGTDPRTMTDPAEEA